MYCHSGESLKIFPMPGEVLGPVGKKRKALLYWPSSESNTTSDSRRERSREIERRVSQFSAGSVCMREQTNESGDPPPPLSISLPQTSESPYSLSLSRNWNIQGKCDKPILVCRQPTFPHADTTGHRVKC